jgi:hypothetical protein
MDCNLCNRLVAVPGVTLILSLLPGALHMPNAMPLRNTRSPQCQQWSPVAPSGRDVVSAERARMSGQLIVDLLHHCCQSVGRPCRAVKGTIRTFDVTPDEDRYRPQPYSVNYLASFVLLVLSLLGESLRATRTPAAAQPHWLVRRRSFSRTHERRCTRGLGTRS